MDTVCHSARSVARRIQLPRGRWRHSLAAGRRGDRANLQPAYRKTRCDVGPVPLDEGRRSASSPSGGAQVNKDQWQGKWRQARGTIKKEWGKLTDDDLDQVQGDYDRLIGKIQERYGTQREEIERRIKVLQETP